MLAGLDQRTASIYAPIQPKLARVEEHLRSLPQTSLPDLEPLLSYVLTSGGKRIRPAITLLAADCYPHDQEKPLIMAGAVELLHLATLIHDDMVDNSDLRRGKPTVTKLWGKDVAVLFGDYLFATSATFVCDTGNVRVIRRFAETIMELASGELLEIFHAFDSQDARRLYQERIYRKTASLFCTAAETGAVLGGAPEPQVKALRDYGYQIGMAFQMVDDLLDVLGDPAELGKPVGSDLRQGVLTLPSILLLERYPENNPIQAMFRQRKQNDGDAPENPANLERALEIINNSGILPDCYAQIRECCRNASQSLELLPDCPARRSLRDLADYVWERSR
ncbi:MAG: polyprenyl synthetase family protein [Dehalococcoidia bacterium]|nr:polyprenyl synthetase family protein [Dehalococcoidia bacterium]MSQ17666.1 polyprenyl synthetase family protein [Dehalococcoidia bacterium]